MKKKKKAICWQDNYVLLAWVRRRQHISALQNRVSQVFEKLFQQREKKNNPSAARRCNNKNESSRLSKNGWKAYEKKLKETEQMPSIEYFSCSLWKMMDSVLFQGRLALAGVIKPQKDQESGDPGSHPDHKSCETLGNSSSGHLFFHWQSRKSSCLKS